MFNEIVEGLEAILAAGHMGVVVHLVKSCVEREETQGPMLQNLLQVRHTDADSVTQHRSECRMLRRGFAIMYNNVQN